jgi:hypothetical protein
VGDGGRNIQFQVGMNMSDITMSLRSVFKSERYQHYYEKMVMLALEGWKFCSDGTGHFCYIMKGDEHTQIQLYELYTFAASVLRDWREAKRFDEIVEQRRNEPLCINGYGI